MSGADVTSMADRGEQLGRVLAAELDAFWGSSAAASYPVGADRFDSPLIQTSQDQATESANPYWEIVRRLPRFPGSGELFANLHIPALPSLRGIKGQLRRHFAYAIPSPGDIRWIADTVRAHHT